MSQELNNEHFGGIFYEADTNVRQFGIGELLHLVLHFEQETVSVHVLSHLGGIATSRLIVEVRVTDDGLASEGDVEVLADLLEDLFVGVVPSFLLEKVVGILMSSLVREWVDVDFRAVKTSSEIVNGLHDLTAHLTHLVKGWQVRVLWVLVEVERLILVVSRLVTDKKEVKRCRFDLASPQSWKM